MTPDSYAQFQPRTSTDVGPDAEFEMTGEVHLVCAAVTIAYVAALRLAARFRSLGDDFEEVREMIARVVIEQAFVPYQGPGVDCITVTLPVQDVSSRLEREPRVEAVALLASTQSSPRWLLRAHSSSRRRMFARRIAASAAIPARMRSERGECLTLCAKADAFFTRPRNSSCSPPASRSDT